MILSACKVFKVLCKLLPSIEPPLGTQLFTNMISRPLCCAPRCLSFWPFLTTGSPLKVASPFIPWSKLSSSALPQFARGLEKNEMYSSVVNYVVRHVEEWQGREEDTPLENQDRIWVSDALFIWKGSSSSSGHTEVTWQPGTTFGYRALWLLFPANVQPELLMLKFDSCCLTSLISLFYPLRFLKSL